MFLLVHLKADGSAHWSSTATPYVPADILGPGDFAVVIHPMDLKVGVQAESDANGTEVQ